MKRLLTSLLIVCLLIASIGTLSVFAADDGQVIHYVTEKETTVEVEVKIKGTATDVEGITMYTAYDAKKVTYLSGNCLNDGTGKGTGVIVGWDLAGFSNKNTASPAYIYYGASPSGNSDLYFTVPAGEEATIATFVFNKIAGQTIDANTIFHSTSGVKAGLKWVYSDIITGQGSITHSSTSTSYKTVFTPYAVEENKITAAISGNGRVFVDGAAIADGGSVTLAEGESEASIKIVPNNGYEVSVATLTGETGNIVGAAGGLHTATISGAADLAVTFTAKADLAENKPIPASATFAETKDVDGKPVEARTAFATAPTAGIEEAGLYIEKDGVAFITNTRDAVGPYFKSDNTNANGQYGIELIALGEGTYTATPYVKIGGEYVLASSSATFTVE